MLTRIEVMAFRVVVDMGWELECIISRHRDNHLLYFGIIMKIFGYKSNDTETDGLMEMSDIAFSASPETLRSIAKFLNKSADDLEEMGDEFDHVHLMDEWSGWKEGTPDIQVINEK